MKTSIFQNMSEVFKHACQLCGGHIAYERAYVGRTIECPHCGREITLPATLPAGQPSAQPGNAGQTPEPEVARCRVTVPRIAAAIVLLTLIIGVGVGLRITANWKLERTRQEAKELARAKVETERIKAEAAKAEAEAEMAKLRAEEEEKAKTAAKAAAEAEASTSAEAAKAEAQTKARVETERKSRAKKDPALWALWEEPDHEAIQLVTTRGNDATVNHKGTSVTARYDDMPEWLRIAARTKHKNDGEAKGLIREVNGRIYDLRTSPPGWLTLPTAEVLQILEDGYLLIDERSLGNPYGLRVFKLVHNGLVRILNKGDRIQVTAMSLGTFTYENKNAEVKTVPVYDPGMPVGPLRERVVMMNSQPAPVAKGATPSLDQPVGNGSGFFISEDGLFVSNAHVVEDSTKIEVRTAAGKKDATVLRIDQDKDLALLRVSVVKGTVPALSISTNNILLGAQVFTIGYPLVELQGTRPKFTDGRVSSLAGMRDDPDQMQISVPVQPGNSGGPLADMNGDIVGVVVSRMNDIKVIGLAGAVPQNVNYAVKGATLVRFLKENKSLAPDVRLGNAPQRSLQEAIKTVEKASGLVLIYRTVDVTRYLKRYGLAPGD